MTLGGNLALLASSIGTDSCLPANGVIDPLQKEGGAYTTYIYSQYLAALGAQMALLSEPERHRAERIARSIEHVSLAAHPDFQDIFVDCMNFPR